MLGFARIISDLLGLMGLSSRIEQGWKLHTETTGFPFIFTEQFGTHKTSNPANKYPINLVSYQPGFPSTRTLMLTIVATPIGNLSDASDRMVQTLAESDLIACEDTRVSGKLLSHFGIETKMISFHQHNEHKKLDSLIEWLKQGKRISLISDAGMPAISDPGFLAVRAAHQHGIPVSVVPGPDALTSALAVSGLPSDRFRFEGFIPAKKGRQTRVQEIAASDITNVVYESPYRVVHFLEMLSEFAEPTRWVCVAREITKKFEEVRRGQLAEQVEEWKGRAVIKGEFVVVIAGRGYAD